MNDYILSGLDHQAEVYPRKRTPWSIAAIIVVLALVFVLAFVFSLLSTRLLDRVLNIFPGLNTRAMTSFVVSSLLQTVLFISLVLGAAKLVYHAPLATLGLRACRGRDLLLYGFLCGLGLFILVTGLMALAISLVQRNPQPQPFAAMVMRSQNLTQLYVLLGMGGILGPLGEEIYFRGFVYPALRSRWGVWPGAVISGCFFGFLHFDLLRFIPLAIGGTCLALICEKSKSIWPAWAAHGTWNIVMTLLVFFGQSSL